jgi:hypothetical protein
MKLLKLLLPAPVILFAVVSMPGIGLTSCQKTTKIDTLTITKVDTLEQLDTVY